LTNLDYSNSVKACVSQPFSLRGTLLADKNLCKTTRLKKMLRKPWAEEKNVEEPLG
jgi:hypothetical protein